MNLDQEHLGIPETGMDTKLLPPAGITVSFSFYHMIMTVFFMEVFWIRIRLDRDNLVLRIWVNHSLLILILRRILII